MAEAHGPGVVPGYGPRGLAEPDPSVLTTQMLLREITSLDRILTEKLNGMTERLNAIEKAQELFHSDLVRVPTAVQLAVSQLKELHEKWFSERFASIQTQFQEREIRADQISREAKAALDAALAAQKEVVSEQNRASALAIAKSETAIAKQLEQLMTLVYSTTGALDSKIGDLKDRVGLIEGRGSGMATSWGVGIAALGALVGITGVIIAFAR